MYKLHNPVPEKVIEVFRSKDEEEKESYTSKLFLSSMLWLWLAHHLSKSHLI